ncbi:glycerol-3-phosphate responsive antiterminator [Thermosediminibacter litoriperuensis]|uniref:Glycerol uptake operon antiterminator n=1 Tax=Thermosediminibacter litoriperuensis TaxID=291989 RepID=A0A5S5AZF7_9FIRM|nr:glycerol-3-phosphate responsive antiterminator [Thermosediminibacter litoriperuensis]TYP58841.1 glycerol uptake operon antiterminator [Thermosediminibacter litoriperuensis]
MRDILADLKAYPIIAAIRDIDAVDLALDKPVRCIFMLAGDILNIKYPVTHIKKARKRVFLHMDLLEGVSKDAAGLRYVSEEIRPDGIITTRSNLISSAKSEGIFAIQRAFFLDSQAVDTAVRTIRQVDPDAVEILPGVIPKIIKRLHENVNHLLIAGGLIEDKKEVNDALEAGAWAVSVSREDLWDAF